VCSEPALKSTGIWGKDIADTVGDYRVHVEMSKESMIGFQSIGSGRNREVWSMRLYVPCTTWVLGIMGTSWCKEKYQDLICYKYFYGALGKSGHVSTVLDTFPHRQNFVVFYGNYAVSLFTKPAEPRCNLQLSNQNLVTINDRT
jgi:hypothetical protein